MVSALLKAANSAKGRRFHRWIGIIVALYVVMATISGVVHIIMANFYSPPPPVMPQGIVNIESASLPLASIVKKIPDASAVKAVNIKTIQGALWYQVISGEGAPIYINAATGVVDTTLDKAYAQQIAKDYLRRTEGVKKAEYLTGFNDEYLNIYRMLPVYRFDVENNNGERVYVSTVTGSVTLYLNTPRAIGQKMFSSLHKFSFIPYKPVRDILMAVLVISVLITSLMGVGIFFDRLRKRKG